MRFLSVFCVFGALWLMSSSASADCSCLCVDGAPKTVCTSSEEAAASPNACLLQASNRICPEAPALAEPQSYDAPVEGVVNCRKAQIYDAASDGHLAARVCDVAQQN